MKIAVCGSAPSSVQLAPTQDASYSTFLGGAPNPRSPPSEFINDNWQIWGCSPGAWAMLPRSDRWFELHRVEPGKPWFSPEYYRFLCDYRGIVYSGGPVEDWPSHVVYPLARVEAEFSSYFLTSSLSLMMALAILEIEDLRRARASGPQPIGDVVAGQITAAGVAPEEDTIGLFGVDMNAVEEWAQQRLGCQFFVLEAMRRGIGVYVPRESDLLRPEPVYGISEWDHNYIKATARMRELNSRRDAKQAQIGEASSGLQFLSGAVDNMNYMIKTWFSPYGIPAGVTARMVPGTGLGGGTTLERPAAVEQPEYDPAPVSQLLDAGERLGGTGDIEMFPSHDSPLAKAEREADARIDARIAARKKKAKPRRTKSKHVKTIKR